jgi:hypothetical protein
MKSANPFRVTKSTDLTDEQILGLWVRFAQQGDTEEMYDPTSPMPMIILGAKGSGKTHLIRYHSLSVRRLAFAREGISDAEGIQKDKYVGIYIRSNGWNSERFARKGISQDIWEAVFAYYVELWFAQEALAALVSLAGIIVDHTTETVLCERIYRLLDDDGSPIPVTFGDLTEALAKRQRVVDRAVNNAAMTGDLKISVDCGPGVLVFGIPRAFRDLITALRDVLVCYQVDEYENLDEWQQELINTLVRERTTPVTFWIGARLWGMRTYRTRSAGEDLREGSEYEMLKLDERLRQTPADFARFAKTMIIRRLEVLPDFQEFAVSDPSSIERLAEQFDVFDPSWDSVALRNLVKDIPVPQRPYFTALAEQLTNAARTDAAPGFDTGGDIDRQIAHVIDCLQAPEYPLVEKANILKLQQEWAKRKDLLRTAEAIATSKQAYLNGRRSDSYAQAIRHYKSDLIAQLMRTFDQPVPYSGIDDFIKMSEGLPRALITILKHVYSWAQFDGETPFLQGRISIKSQLRGIHEATNWFNEHMRKAGREGTKVLVAVDRLAQLFRENRFAQKPIECSLITLSVNFDELSAEAQSVIQTASERMFLIEIPQGQKERNSFQVTRKYQINRMVCPKYQLPLSRGGAISLSMQDAEAIFDYTKKAEFETCLRRWRGKMNAPYRARARSDNQANLFG